MKNIKNTVKFIKHLKHQIFHSIAFYPVLISIAFIILATILLYVENLEFTQILKEKMPYLIVQDHNTARSILSTLFGATLSLTVFSFTMVMVVLNQASSNFSPRLLPGLISNKKHQIILGFYIGTLLYSIILLMSLGAYGPSGNTIGFSVMMSAVFGALCVGLFVYFIHSISQAVQIHNIINRIYTTTYKLLEEELQEQQKFNISYPDSVSPYWKTIKSKKTGYYRAFDRSLLPDALKNRKNSIEIIPYPDQYIWEGDPVFRIKEPISDEDIQSLSLCLYIVSNQHEDDSSIGGMIKLTEVAVKALSPGINDPGTAINALSKLGQLLHLALHIRTDVPVCIPDGHILIIHHKIPAEELIRIVIQPIRQYAKGDSAVAYHLSDTLAYLKRNIACHTKNDLAITDEIEALRYDVKRHIDNTQDLECILNRLKQ